MCRSILEGGRRCPGHSHPERVAAYNAIRRERYHANKQSNLPEPVASTLAPEFFTPNPLITEANFVELGTLSTVGAGSALGISVTQNEGRLVDVGYFAQTTVRGKLDYTKLTTTSHEALGFSKVSEKLGVKTLAPLKRSYAEEDSEVASELEVKNLPELETRALKYFTSDNYLWVNKGLYENEYSSDSSTSKSIEFETLLKDSEDGYRGYTTSEEHQNKENLRKLTNIMDKALTEGPKKQRILYRGMGGKSKIFEKFGDSNGWVDANAQLGQELKFEGYQSTTNSLHQANEYSKLDGGILFEIRTPEGINVHSNSYWKTEQEVLLPRQARYTVVGVHKDAKIAGYHGIKTVIQLVAINEEGEILDGTNSTPPTAI